MRTALATLLLTLVVCGWFTLALIPALREVVKRTDVEPLQLRRGGGDIRHFALGFQRFVDAELETVAQAAERRPVSGAAIAMRDGQPAWYVPDGEGAVTLPVHWMPRDALSTHVILSEAPLVTPDGCAVLKELYAARTLDGGADCSYRAILAHGDATLGRRSDVLRWIDAGGTLVAHRGSVLYGRASAGVAMHLADGVRFQRVAAPAIHFGPVVSDAPPRTADAEVPLPPSPPVPHARASVYEGTRAPLEPPPGVTESFGRWLVEGDFELPAGEYVASDLVVTGTLRVGAGSRVLGAVKSSVLLGGDAAIYDGAIVATSRLELGAGSTVAGPIVVEGRAELGPGSSVGTASRRTTISAGSVEMGHGGVVYGEVWARSWGEVV